MITIDVMALEFDENNGHTIWVHGLDGTVLRIKCSGRIVMDDSCTNNVAHADLMVEGDIHFCIPAKQWEEAH
jgi:hypothetical protein